MKYVHEILEEVQKTKTKADKIKILQKHDNNWGLKDYLLGSFSEKIKWNLPAGNPPYTPCEEHNAPTHLAKKNKDFRFFVKGGPGDRLPAFKRESIFIGLIEAIHPKEALLVLSMINKEKPKGITKKVVEEAYPGLLD